MRDATQQDDQEGTWDFKIYQEYGGTCAATDTGRANRNVSRCAERRTESNFQHTSDAQRAPYRFTNNSSISTAVAITRDEAWKALW